MVRRTRLLVVSETRLYREGIARALEEEGDRFDLVGTAADLREATGALDQLRPPPEVLVLDHAIREGAEAVRELRRHAPDVRVLAVAVRETEGDVMPWAEAGAAGFLPHDASFTDLCTGVEAVAAGCGHCSPRVTAALLSRVASLAIDPARGHAQPPFPLAELTVREREVALLLQEGLSNKEIALRLRIQVATVKNHVHSILEKMQVRRRGEAASRVRAERMD